MSKLCFGMFARLLIAFAVLSSPFLVGCGAGNGGEPSVVGSVTVDGDPVESGAILFKTSDGRSVAGGVISEGKYNVTVPQGKVKVEIRVPVVIGQEKVYDTPNSPLTDVTKESLPKKYHDRTELEMDVVAGTNTKDWELEGKKKRK